MSILSGYKKYKRYLLTEDGYQLCSQWTSSNTVQFDDGKTAETKLGAINGITDSLSAGSSDFALSAKAGRDLQDQVTLLSPFRYRTSEERTTGYYKIKIKSPVYWMISCSVLLYQNYHSSELTISGYCYSENTWYRPNAILVASDLGSISVVFGKDDDGYVWFAIPAEKHTGITITNLVNGYTGVGENWLKQLELTYQETLTGTTISTVIANAPTRSNTVRNIEKVSALPSDAASNPDTLYIIGE